MIPSTKDWQSLTDYLAAFEQLSTDFLQSVEHIPVAAKQQNAPDVDFSNKGLRLEQAIEILKTQVVPGLSSSRGPRYWGFVTGGATPVATLADWLVTTYDQNVSKGGDSIATEIERQTLGWLNQLFELPQSFKGTFTTGATAANYLAAVTARQFVGHQQGIDVAEEGVFGLDIKVFSTTPHASMVKSLGLAGLGRKQYTQVANIDDSEAMDPQALASALAQSEAKGKVVIASAGTVTGTDFDDLKAIRAICDEHQAWLHVDGAFGIFERLLQGKNGRSQGIEMADSITLDAHKWLNVPYDCGVFLTRHRQYLFASCDVPAPYLVNSSDEPDFMSLGIENSRRFRALPVWLSLLTYGKQGIAHWVEKNIQQAAQLSHWLSITPGYELIHYGELNVVLFRPKADSLDPKQQDEFTASVLQRINQDGRIFLSPGQWQGKKIIRAALSNWQTEQADIEIAKTALMDCLN